MKKIFTLLTAILFAGSMMAQSPRVTLDFTSGGQASADHPWGLPTTADKTAQSYTQGDYTISFGASNTGHKAYSQAVKVDNVATGDTIWLGIIFGKTNATLTFPAFDFKVAKIIVYYASTSGSENVVHNIFVGNDAASTAVTGCKITASKDSSVFEIAAAKQAVNTAYTLKVTSNHNMQLSKVEFYEVVAGAPENPTFSVPAGVYQEAQSVELDCETEGADIFYTLDGTTPSSSSTKYEDEAIVISETTTIKAIAIKNGVSSSVVSATYSIIDLEGNGTKEKPFTVADVIALNNSLTGEKYWVIGYIVGCAANGGAISTGDPLDSNIAIGDAADQTTGLIAVQLPQGDIRTALNVKDNAGNVGKQVKVHGTLENYFQYPGVKTVDEYEMISTGIFDTEVEGKTVKFMENGQIVILKNGVRFNVLGAQL